MDEDRQQVMPEKIFSCFPSLTDRQKEQIRASEAIYRKWNAMINVISRKDMDNFYVHHFLHSLAIARVFDFPEGTRILDAGTGGGFPGIPLAIMFPSVEFTLLDSIGKKIKVASAVALELGLKNVKPVQRRMEEERNKYDFVVSRAVMQFRKFVELASGSIKGSAGRESGIIYLKGGDVSDETGKFGDRITVWNISDFFTDPFFETKKIVYLKI